MTLSGNNVDVNGFFYNALGGLLQVEGGGAGAKTFQSFVNDGFINIDVASTESFNTLDINDGTGTGTLTNKDTINVLASAGTNRIFGVLKTRRRWMSTRISSWMARGRLRPTAAPLLLRPTQP
ncbi:MAG: hypothetical protein U5O39_11865 [Gammaproteobacteria bacterium]|nr:hypothetical protein [Gammaproteobacteria bacterium]